MISLRSSKSPAFDARTGWSWHGPCSILLACAIFTPAMAQNTLAPSGSPTPRGQTLGDIEQRIADLTDALAQTQAALQHSQAELLRLRVEVNALREERAESSSPNISSQTSPSNEASASISDGSVTEEVRSLKEQQEILQAEVEQHEQTKVESASKYGLTVTGVALFNAYSNAGVVDDTELPSLAYPRGAGSSHGSLGGSLRQTVFGIAATGPVIAGAQSSASVNVDFFGGSTPTTFGYSSPEGYVRMRDGEVALKWHGSKLQVGYFGPLVSPLSPTSFATVAQPALSASGNLWIWSPQVSFQQDLPIRNHHGISLEGGLISPASPAYTSTQLDSPVEASRRPGVEGRMAYHSDFASTASPRSFVLGVGTYTANQFYASTTRVHSWGITGDWQIPFSRWVDISGEAYRGRALGGLGAGLYKDVFSGTDPIGGLARTVGIETAGGWTQLKLSLTPRWEANAMFGLDDAFSSSYHSVILAAGQSPLTLTARNSTVSGNIIFRPLAALIFSPEYRRVTTWRFSSGPYIANIFTLSAGYKF